MTTVTAKATETILFLTAEQWTLDDIRDFATSLDSLHFILTYDRPSPWFKGVYIPERESSVSERLRHDAEWTMRGAHKDMELWRTDWIHHLERSHVSLDLLAVQMMSPGFLFLGGGMARLVSAMKGLLESWWKERRRRRNEAMLEELRVENERWKHELQRIRFVKQYLRELGSIIPTDARNLPADFVSEAEATIASQLARIDAFIDAGKIIAEPRALHMTPEEAKRLL